MDKINSKIYQFQGKTLLVDKWVHLTNNWLGENLMTREKLFINDCI